MTNCVFCGIVEKKIPARIVAKNEHALAFLDISPISDGHTVVISKQHYLNFSSTPDEVLASMASLCKVVANKINNSKLKPWGFNYLSNEGNVAGQAVMHIHMHVIPKYGRNEGFVFTTKNHNVNKNLDKVYEIIMNA